MLLSPANIAEAANKGRKLKAHNSGAGLEGAPQRKQGRGKGGKEEEAEAMEEDEEDDESKDHDRPTSDKDFKLLLTLVAQLALSAHHQAAVARAVAIDCLGTKRTAPAVVAMKKYGAEFHAAAMELPKEKRHEMGSPHIGNFVALMESVLAASQATPAHASEDEKLLAPVIAFLDKVKTYTTTEEQKYYIGQSVRYCRVAPAFKSDMAKVEVAARYVAGALEGEQCLAVPCWEAAKLLLRRRQGMQVKMGTAPMTNIERRVTKMMTAMGKLKRRSGGDW